MPRISLRIIAAGLVIPGGGYLVTGAWRRGLAFLSIGLLVTAIFTDLFTEFGAGIALFWAVLCAAGILGAEEATQHGVPDAGLGLARVANGTALLVGLGLVAGAIVSALGGVPDDAQSMDMLAARGRLLFGEAFVHALGGAVIALFSIRPVQTAFWSTIFALGWAFVRGTSDLGLESTWFVMKDRWPQVLVLYGVSLAAAVIAAFLTARLRPRT
jgi:hypothetical protein